MKLIITTLFAFVLFDNSFKLSAGSLISTIEHDVENGVKVLPKVVKDSAPIVGQMPFFGPAARLGQVIGTDMKQAFQNHKKVPNPGYGRREFRPRMGGYQEFHPRAGGFQGGFNPRAGGFQGGFNPRAGGFQGGFNPRAGEFHGGLNPRVEGFAGNVNPRVEGFAGNVNPRVGEFPGNIPSRTGPGEYQRFGRVGQIANQQGMYSNVGYPQNNNN